jgi:hypothetical protein
MEAPMRSLLPLLLVVALYSDTALGQDSPSPLARADIAATIGSFSAKRADAPEYDRWTHSLAGSVGGGYYWSDHLKTEIDVASARRAEVYGSESAGVPESPLSTIFLEHAYRSSTVSLGQSYQFRRNAFFHPFVGAGVDVERLSHEIERPPQSISIYARNPLNPQVVSVTGQISIPALTRTETTVIVSPFAAAGFKAYFTERGFFRTDLKVGLRNDVDRVSWRAGFGADF